MSIEVTKIYKEVDEELKKVSAYISSNEDLFDSEEAIREFVFDSDNDCVELVCKRRKLSVTSLVEMTDIRDLQHDLIYKLSERFA